MGLSDRVPSNAPPMPWRSQLVDGHARRTVLVLELDARVLEDVLGSTTKERFSPTPSQGGRRAQAPTKEEMVVPSNCQRTVWPVIRART